MARDSIFKFFTGRRLLDVRQVVAYVGVEEYVLTDTAVFVFEDSRVQVFVDVHEKLLREMANPVDIVVQGDYPDLTALEQRSFGVVKQPFWIGGVRAVWEAGSATDYLVGAFLSAADGEIMLGVNVHLDDVEVGEPIRLLQYVAAVMESRDLLITQ